MATKRDYYEILGINKSATDAEIKSAYRKLARAHHPDVDKTTGAAERFKEISEAYQVLSEPEKRKTYDQFGRSAFEPGAGAYGGANPFAGGGNPFGGFKTYSWSSKGGGPSQGFDFGGFADPFDLFEQIFGGFGGGQGFGQGFRPQPSYQMEISFDEAIHGADKEIQFQDERGKIKRITIKVPAGVDNGTRIRFGEIEIVFRVKKNPDFIREGSDIFSEINVSVPDLVLGDIVEVKTIWGKVKLKIPAGTEPGSLIKIRDQGAPSLRGGKGDHYVRVRLEVPKKITSEEKNLYEKLANLKGKKKTWF